MDRYYKKATELLEKGDEERAITFFISGLERGYEKCAYGLLCAVVERGSYTFTEDEATSIFKSSYGKIKEKAIQGDTEAMVMVAQAQRLGFVDDEDEPYLFWFTKAIEGGSLEAKRIYDEIEDLEKEIAPLLTEDECGNLIKQSKIDVDEAGLRAMPDKTMMEELGIANLMMEKENAIRQMLMVNGGIDPKKAFDF